MLKKSVFTSVLLSLVILAGCTPATQIEQPESQTPNTDETLNQNDQGMMEADENLMAEADQELTIDMFMFGYSVEEITASPGDTIKVNLTNSEGMHDFDIDELSVDSEVIQEGETTSVTFTIPEDVEPGTEYAYYCSVGNHRAQGMEGKLIIE